MQICIVGDPRSQRDGAERTLDLKCGIPGRVDPRSQRDGERWGNRRGLS